MVLAENPDADALEIEMMFRAAASSGVPGRHRRRLRGHRRDKSLGRRA